MGRDVKATWPNTSQHCGLFVFHRRATRMKCFGLERGEKKRRKELLWQHLIPVTGKEQLSLSIKKENQSYFSRRSTESCGMERLSGLISSKKRRLYRNSCFSSTHALTRLENAGEKKKGTDDPDRKLVGTKASAIIILHYITPPLHPRPLMLQRLCHQRQWKDWFWLQVSHWANKEQWSLFSRVQEREG